MIRWFLGYTLKPRPPDRTMSDCWQWFADNIDHVFHPTYSATLKKSSKLWIWV